MDIRGKRFVVVGGAGLIGSHTVDRLLQEDVKTVVVYDNMARGSRDTLASALADPRVVIYDVGGDILQTDILQSAFDGADGVFHFAALWLLQCHDYPRTAFDVNVRGTFNVLEACVAKGVTRLVYSSSASVYGDAIREPMDEDHPFNNASFYGATKIAGEAMLRAYHHRFGLDFVGLRYMNVYGPRQQARGPYVSVIVSMLNALDVGEPPTIHGDGSQSFDFIHVHDCARANVLAMKSTQTDRFYNVGTGVKTSLIELARLLSEIHPNKKNPIFRSNPRPSVRNRIGCISLAQSELGFRADIPIDQGLKDLLAWRRELQTAANSAKNQELIAAQ